MSEPAFVKNDPFLKFYTQFFTTWSDSLKAKETELTGGDTLADFALGHHFFGLFKEKDRWVIREWIPDVTSVYLIGSFNNWEEREEFLFRSIGNGNWELELPLKTISHGSLYSLSIHWNGIKGKRVPAWSRYTTQDKDTLIFNAEVWSPQKQYQWKNSGFRRSSSAPVIYEAHVGMAGEEHRVHTYNEFRELMLPRIKKAGYNTIQLMAIHEHPYYGSFGYHVSCFFAPSSRFGTPDELKALIDEAHGMGLAVVMDIVHSHAIKNEIEGLGNYNGTRYQFFHEGSRGEHAAWDSYCFNYEKNEVLHFLLSNLRYWLEEFHFDGFRFDGVTSMLYLDHGLGKNFTSYDDYFSHNLDISAVIYCMLANKLIHQINPDAITIAEEMSGLPGLAARVEDDGIGFDYRMAMGVPDYWIKLIKESSDEEWNISKMFYELTSHREEEKVISYVESHDQALVGDKTIIFRLIDKEMYSNMRKDQTSLLVNRGIALHKMIRLITATCAGGGYLNFMGNEFGHPEWVDFPRQGNNWSYQYARRIWSVSNDPELCYHWLQDFDHDMIEFINKEHIISRPKARLVFENNADQVLAYTRGGFLFVFNFNPVNSFEGYGIELPASKYKIVLHTDANAYGGQNRIDDTMEYCTLPSKKEHNTHYLKLYLPARTAIVLKVLNFK